MLGYINITIKKKTTNLIKNIKNPNLEKLHATMVLSKK